MKSTIRNDTTSISTSVDHRTSCHRCGNIRKNLLKCTVCPQVFCNRCTDKMLEEHGGYIFVNGCPVFHCYKKCPTTRAGGMNFGLCTPTDAVKMMTKDIRYPLIRSGTPHVICDDDNHQSNVQAAVCEEQLILPRYKHDNTITAGANIYTYDSLNGTMITSHGLMDDIERYFTSADGWDKTESPRSTRLYSEEESHCSREYYFDSTSSTSDKNTIIYIDSTIKDMYPFLSTPTPQTPGSLFSPLTGTLLVGRTSSLPIPCTQDGYSRHARMTNSRPVCIPIIDNNEEGAKERSDVSVDFAVRNKEPFTSIVGPDACGSYLGKSEIDRRTGWCLANQKPLTRREEALSLSNSDVYNYDEPAQSLMGNKSSSAAKKGSRGRTLKSSQCDREPELQHDSHDMRTSSRRGRTKRSLVTLSDTLLLSHATVSPNGEIPGLLEDFLSSNYFIKDDFNDSTSPFFMQQSFQCYPKAQSIEELLAKSTSLGIDPITGSVRSSSKKRYRKHQASVSAAKKVKVPSSVDDDKNWATSLRKKVLDVQVPYESVMYGLREVGPDDDDRMAGVYCEDTERYTSTQGRDIWTALQRPGYDEDTDEVPVGRARAVTCDTIPYSEIKCSPMLYAASSPVSGRDVDPTKSEVYPRDIADTADNSKKDIVLNDANAINRQFAVKSQVPLEDDLFQPSSHLRSDGLATHGDQRSAGCVHRSGHSTHDTDVERILLYTGEPTHVDSSNEYVAEAQDLPQEPAEARTMTPDCAILPVQISSPLSRRGADRVWYSCQFHDDGLNGAGGAAGRSGTLAGTERVDQELSDASTPTPTPTVMLAEGLREHWNSYKSTIPTFVPASSTGSTCEVSPSVFKGVQLAGHQSGVGVGLSLKSTSSPCLGSETDPRRSPASTVAIATATATDAVKVLTSSDPHQPHTHSDASVVVEDVSALLIPKKNSPYYGYSTVGHGFQYPSVRENRTPTGTFTGLNSNNSATINDLRASYEHTEESTPNVSLSTPLLDNISFSPFLNFTPESDIRPSESRLMFGERGKPRMKPYGMSTVSTTRHAVHEDIFSCTRTANPNAATESSSASLTLPNTMESNIGWLDDAFLYDLVAE